MIKTTNILGIMALAFTANAYDRTTVDLEFVSRLAEKRAHEETAETPHLPDSLKKLTYDDYRKIRFRRNEALWLGQDFQFVVDFLHPGYLYNDPVLVYESTDTHVQQVPFNRAFFDYSQTALEDVDFPENMGFSGLRIRYPLNHPSVRDDLIVFQGTSYFRALGKGISYGLSARALGVDIGGQETFPRFTQLWIKKPADPQANTLKIYGLLEGKNVTGAYEFTIHPGDPTSVDVHSRVWPINNSPLCFVPLTSMYFFGENSDFEVKDWRPEVHDSDGLLIADVQGWRWRPLINPSSLSQQTFPTNKLKGFGLLQRDRRFTSYKDMEAKYQTRPTVWIEPIGKWSAGTIILVEAPVSVETEDNVNAFWRPKMAPLSGQFYDLSYRMTWRAGEPNTELANVIETRVGQKTLHEKASTVAVEFTPPLGIHSSNVNELTMDFDAGGATVLTPPQLHYNEAENCVRVIFDLQQTEQVHDLTLQLKHQDKPTSEMWIYRWDSQRS